MTAAEPKGGRLGPGKAFVTLYLDLELVKQVDRLAAAQDLSRSKYLTSVIREGIQKDELAVSVMTDPVVSKALLGAFAQPEVMRSMMAAVRGELSDQQLGLFQRALTAGLEKASTPPAAKRTPRAAKRDKRKGIK